MTLVQRTEDVLLAVGVLAAAALNPHFIQGGAYDLYGPIRWQSAGGALSVALVLFGAILLVLGRPGAAFRVVVAEGAFYLLLNAAAAATVGAVHFASGWGGGSLWTFMLAVVLRAWLAARAASQRRSLRGRHA